MPQSHGRQGNIGIRRLTVSVRLSTRSWHLDSINSDLCQRFILSALSLWKQILRIRSLKYDLEMWWLGLLASETRTTLNHSLWSGVCLQRYSLFVNDMQFQIFALISLDRPDISPSHWYDSGRHPVDQ